jgi:CBS domain containing-hemolysin-like protein
MVGYLVVILVCLVLSAFFASAEIAYTSLNRVRLEYMAENGSRRAKCAVKIREEYDRTLCSILVCNDLVNVLTSSVATALALLLMAKGLLTEPQANILPTFVTTVVVLIFGDIIPKMLAKQYALTYALLIAYPLRVITWVLYPIAYPVSRLVARITQKGKEAPPSITEEDLSLMIEVAEEEGELDEDKGELLQSALDYQEKTVEEIITPRINLSGIALDATEEEIRDLCNTTPHSRLLVYEETIDEVVGVLSVTQYLKMLVEHPHEGIALSDMMTKPYFVHPTAKLPKVLREMKKRQTHMAVVLDEYGGTLGIVTMEDILEEIVGDIWDENDTILPDEIVTLDENTYEVEGIAPISDFFTEADVDDFGFESAYTTMGGWAVEMLEEDPHTGDTFTWKDLTVTVLEMNDNLVTRLSVVKTEAENDEEEEI